MNQQETIAEVNGLIRVCADGERRFRHHAKHVRSPRLAVILASLGDNCQQRARDLQNQVLHLHGRPALGGSRWGAVQRGWLSLRNLFGALGDLAILKQCQRDEDRALAHYRAALQKPLPDPLRLLLERQYLGAQCTSVRVTELLLMENAAGPRRYHPFENGGRSLPAGRARDTAAP